MSKRLTVILGTGKTPDHSNGTISWVAGIYEEPIAAMKALTKLEAGATAAAKNAPRYSYARDNDVEFTKVGTAIRATDPEAPAKLHYSQPVTYKMDMGPYYEKPAK
jgi:hypothetical protein